VPGTAIPSIPKKSRASEPRLTLRIINQAITIPIKPASGVAMEAMMTVDFSASLAIPLKM